ncbi:hypothetical protein ACFXPA_46045 [Amycolatopsis sp. NPDC059090]|uniref:hypothetical protein n=1 Tax=Amycolatopsis sp. NPDC059090 TaxID=3346723 RepID=UPI00366CEC69
MTGFLGLALGQGRETGAVASQFAAEVRRGISEAQRATTVAMETGHPYEAYLHRTRLAELLEIAERHDIDTAALVRAEVLTALAEDEAASER